MASTPTKGLETAYQENIIHLQRSRNTYLIFYFSAKPYSNSPPSLCTNAKIGDLESCQENDEGCGVTLTNFKAWCIAGDLGGGFSNTLHH